MVEAICSSENILGEFVRSGITGIDEPKSEPEFLDEVRIGDPSITSRALLVHPGF